MRAGCGSNVTATALAPCCRARCTISPQHVRVRPVHAVKVADAHQRRPKSRGNIFEFVENLHERRQLLIVDR